MIGYSILIFELDQEEIDRALHANLSELVGLIEEAAQRPFSPAIH